MLAVFVALQARVRNPLLPLRIVADRNRGASFISIGIASGEIFAVSLFLTYYLQQARGLSPITTGLAFLPMTVTVMSFAIVGLTRLQSRFGPRSIVVAGMLLGSLGSRISLGSRWNPLTPPESFRRWSSSVPASALSSRQRSATPRSA